MSYLKPMPTLLVGIALGMFIIPKAIGMLKR